MTKLLISFFLKSSGPLLGFFIYYIVSTNYSKEVLGFYAIFMQALIFLGILVRGGNEFILLKFGRQLNVMSNSSLLIILHRRILVNFILLIIVFLAVLGSVNHSNQFLQKIGNHPFLFSLSVLSFAIFNMSITFLISVNKINESIFFQSLLFQLIVLGSLFILPSKITTIFEVFITVSISLTIIIYLIFNQFKSYFNERVFVPSGRIKGFSLTIAEFLMFNSDLLVLSFFVSLHTVAVYALASRLVMVYGFYVQVQNAYVVNLVASSLNDTSIKISEILRKTLITNFKILPIYVLGIFIISEMTTVYFGEQYKDILKYVRVLFVSGVFGILFGFSVSFYHLITKDTKGSIFKKLNYICSIIFITMLLISAYFFGVDGVSYSILVFKAIYYSSFYLLSRNYVRKRNA